MSKDLFENWSPIMQLPPVEAVLGMVVWTGQVSVAALLLVLLLSWRPATGFALIGASLAACLPIYLL